MNDILKIGDIVRYQTGTCNYQIVKFYTECLHSKNTDMAIIKALSTGREYKSPLKNLVLAEVKKAKEILSYEPVKVIQHEPATIVYFADDTKVVSKVASGETFNPYIGIQACILKKVLGSKLEYNRIMKVAQNAQSR